MLKGEGVRNFQNGDTEGYFIFNIYTFENKNYNHQVHRTFCTWDLNQKEPAQGGYKVFKTEFI